MSILGPSTGYYYIHSATGQVSIFFSIQYDIQTIGGMLFLSKLCITSMLVIVNDKAVILLQVLVQNH